KVLIERWWRHYNTRRPHSALSLESNMPILYKTRTFSSPTQLILVGTGQTGVPSGTAQ
ncbi:MAG: hypothetical protein EBU59_05555, partial [Planctomycetia bacterium]|nr:hypothetical protein [Planctomycetia bacterium]